MDAIRKTEQSIAHLSKIIA